MDREHERHLESIDLAVDGALEAVRTSELEEHLAGCADCRRELVRAEGVVERLAAARIAVRPGFAGEVLSAIVAREPAPWEARAPRSWWLPIALLLLVGGASATLIGTGAGSFAPAGGAGGALLALADLFRAALVAGGGLATASWRAVGDAAGSWLGESPVNWAAALVLVGGANYLLFRLLRVRRSAVASATLGGDEARHGR